MDSWAPLAPTPRFSLSNVRGSVVGASGYARASLSLPSPSTVDEGASSSAPSAEPLVGTLPYSVILRILEHVPLKDLPACSLAGRQLARVVASEEVWKSRLEALDWVDITSASSTARIPDGGAQLAPRAIGRRRERGAADEAKALVQPAAAAAAEQDDDFGDFSGASNEVDDSFGDFTSAPPARVPGGSLAAGLASVALGGGSSRPSLSPTAASKGVPLFSFGAESSLPLASRNAPSFLTLKALVAQLRPHLRSLPSSGSLGAELNLASQAALCANSLRYLSPGVLGGGSRPSSSLETLLPLVQASARSTSAAALTAFEGALARREDALRAAAHGADTARATRRAEDDMRASAEVSWELEQALGERAGKRETPIATFLGGRKVLALAAKHQPKKNVVTKADSASLDFTPMDTFMGELLGTVATDGNVIARVFPPTQDVLIQYAERVAGEVIAEYIKPLLLHTKSLSSHLYLRSCAATFTQSMRLVDALLAVEERDEQTVTRTRCEDVVYRMWESNMDDYLATERQWVRAEMGMIASKWMDDLENETAASRTDAAFLTSQNPAAVKRSVLSGFKDVLLLPVTVVPRTAVYVGGAAIRTAGTGLSKLNPLAWQGGAAAARAASPSPALPVTPNTAALSEKADASKGYMDFSNGGSLGLPDDDDDEEEEEDQDPGLPADERDEWSAEVEAWGAVASARPEPAAASVSSKRTSTAPSTTRRTSLAPTNHTATTATTLPSSSTTSRATSRSGTPQPKVGGSSFASMQLLLSLDTALQLIHVNRDCLKRIETFEDYPGDYGHRVRREIEQIAAAFLQVLGEAHISPGFRKATQQIRSWDPAAKPADASGNEKSSNDAHVVPLVNFFELVHVADTIQQMVQVYFDQELSRHIDRTDFLNSVVREKKKFEGALDEAVAQGLNAGVDLLMGQAEHIITTRQTPRDYYPEPGQDMDLGPTKACQEAVECLRTHCKMLVGSTDKNILEVFNLEVGMRLHAILCKHLKRQIISLDGGFKVIADLNAYHAFATTLRNGSITAQFDALKMLGNIYIIDNPKELAQIVRDASSLSLSPEDAYEHVKARADFKAIESTLDKEMYGFKIKDDCTIC